MTSSAASWRGWGQWQGWSPACVGVLTRSVRPQCSTDGSSSSFNKSKGTRCGRGCLTVSSYQCELGRCCAAFWCCCCSSSVIIVTSDSTALPTSPATCSKSVMLLVLVPPATATHTQAHTAGLTTISWAGHTSPKTSQVILTFRDSWSRISILRIWDLLNILETNHSFQASTMNSKKGQLWFFQINNIDVVIAVQFIT